MDARAGEGLALELVGELERLPRRRRGRGLRLRRGGEAEQEHPAELVMVALVRLDHVAVHRRGLPVAGVLAELDKLTVLHDRDRLARELPCGHALHRRLERIEIVEQWAVALGERIERARVEAEGAEPVGDHPVVLGLVADLTRQRQLDVDLVGGDEPARGDLGGLDLVLERHLQEVEHGQIAVDFRLQRVVRRQPLEPPLVLPVELRDELFGRHSLTPSFNRRGSSCVSVSLVTTRSHRACQGWVWRASACVVNPSTGGRARASAPKSRS